MAGGLAAAETQWLTNLPQAESQARKENKLVLLDFTGSDWCPACIKLEKGVLSQSEFAAYAAKNLVLVLVDFPAGKPQTAAVKAANQALLEKFNVEGYPTLLLLKPDGKQVWQTVGYSGEPPADIIAKIDSARKKV
jgi:protein disulfide-isomerase